MKLTATFLGLTIMALIMTSNCAETDKAQVEQEAMRILDEFVRTTNTRETEAHVAILHQI